jgi:hypothetical protein
VKAEGGEPGYKATVANFGDLGDKVHVEPDARPDPVLRRLVPKSRLIYGWE